MVKEHLSPVKLGVNVDHVATLRQARGGRHPSPREGALQAEKGGADGITVHLREDRRHIQDTDVTAIKKSVRVPLNLEMSLNPEIVRIALWVRPAKVCFVPERRKELTTEGGLDARAEERILKRVIPRFKKQGIEVSLFIDPDPKQIQAAYRVQADAIEIHTGSYAEARGLGQLRELERIEKAVRIAGLLQLKVHAGHGLDYANVKAVARIPGIRELNIGHSIVSHAVMVGMRNAVREMKKKIAKACENERKKTRL